MKRAVQSALRLGAEGIKITKAAVSAVLKSPVWNGIAKVAFRCTLRANVDCGSRSATAYGIIGIKAGSSGEILAHDPTAQDRLMMEVDLWRPSGG